MIEPLRLSFVVECPVEHAFDVWTVKTSRWWPVTHTVTSEQGLDVVFEGRLGGRIFERTPAGVEVDWGQITIWEPPWRLGYLWHIRTDRADATEVEITFQEEGQAGTRVDIEHRGWERLGSRGPRWRDVNLGGWNGVLPSYVAACLQPRHPPTASSRMESDVDEGKDAEGVPYRDGDLALHDGRRLSWRWWGEPGHRTVLRLQGTPASRVYRHPDSGLWRSLGVRMLMADRPGFGGSSRLPGRGFSAVADDLAVLMDTLGLERVPVVGFSGGGPHVLAFAARHPDRVSAATVVVGAAPLVPEERARLVGVNRAGHEAADQGWTVLHAYLEEVRQRVLSVGVAGVLDDAPAGDREIMADPAWQRIDRVNSVEALRQGAEGWTDETLALVGTWDFEPVDVQGPITWWHGTDDANAPLSAAERIVGQLPKARLHVWRDEGHFAAIRHEEEVLRDLLSRT